MTDQEKKSETWIKSITIRNGTGSILYWWRLKQWIYNTEFGELMIDHWDPMGKTSFWLEILVLPHFKSSEWLGTYKLNVITLPWLYSWGVHVCVLSCSSRVWRFVTLWTVVGSSVRGILQRRILEWVAVPSSRGSSCPRKQTRVF